MKQKLLTGLLVALSSTNAFSDELRPYIGVSLNAFAISTSELKGTNTSSGFNATSTSGSRDSGSTAGLSGGVMINDNGKINFAYFSGEEKDSKFMTTTITSLSYDHSFNGSGVHQGWFVGGGLSTVEIEAEETEFTAAGSAKATGVLLRGGYEYLFDNSLFLEIGLNANLAEVDLKFGGKGSASSLEFDSKMKVSNVYATINYAF
jgi:hypothetical protein